MKTMLLLLDVGNTHTHLGLADSRRVLRQANLPTAIWKRPADALGELLNFTKGKMISGVALCSVVPEVTPRILAAVRKQWKLQAVVLTPKTTRGVGIDYPKPATIGPDRLANAIAARHHHGAPAVVVDFGTAVTFDVINRCGDYVGGIIAPGLAVMTEYLHEKTALLPRIVIRDEKAVVGRNTRQAMLIGAVHGYRGLVRELILKLKTELGAKELPVIATGGYAQLMAKELPEITGVNPVLTLEGLRLTWLRNKTD